jgi:C-terminal processing protease CtpA/Prc
MKVVRWMVMIAVMIAVSLGLSACREDEPAPLGPNEYVNNWILENMQAVYYWNSSIPANPDKSLTPPDFFDALLDPADRFSFLQENYLELQKQLQGIRKEAGYDFTLYRETANSDNLVAQLIFVKANSPATAAGMKRGDLITHINGERLTISNYQGLLAKLGENHSVTIQSYNETQQTFNPAAALSLVPVELVENPILFKSVITLSGKKIGYLVYRFFAPGPGNQYLNEMDQAFQEFRDAGVSDFVLDLRFNNGGTISAATNLASLVGRDIDNSKAFYKLQYNANIMQEIRNDPRRGEASLTQRFVSKSQNIGSLLNTGNVYVLTSTRTASASEMVMNGLRPFMNVVSIGGTTAGKDLGSVTIFEENDPQNTWGLQPIVVRLVNANDQGYPAGFTPSVPLADNSLLLFRLGDVRERLLNKALEMIVGAPVSGRAGELPSWGEEVASSLDATARLREPRVESINRKPKE